MLFKNNDNSEEPLNVKLYMKGSQEFTLIDLPGITYTNKAFTDKIKNLIKTNIKSRETLILLVIQATRTSLVLML
jgi:hypothetical protein